MVTQSRRINLQWNLQCTVETIGGAAPMKFGATLIFWLYLNLLPACHLKYNYSPKQRGETYDSFLPIMSYII